MRSSSAIEAATQIEAQALAALSMLVAPELPGDQATELELAKFQSDLGRYQRTVETFSRIAAQARETKNALVRAADP